MKTKKLTGMLLLGGIILFSACTNSSNKKTKTEDSKSSQAIEVAENKELPVIMIPDSPQGAEA